ncbi:MAG: Tryptophan--tRNA ligase 2 [Pseudomonadota bacterium]|jgi:tryptophanyl-tRNA synthetase
MKKPVLLTGDTPTGKLHLGHWVGSVENRVNMQSEYDCFFLIANMHAFTTRWNNPKDIHDSVIDLLLDYLALGIDPKHSTIFLQSEIPAIAELTFLFSMLLSYHRVLRNPTLKDEIRDKGLGETYPFGFLLYAVGQVADILAFKPDVVPVGEDQIPHLEMAKEVARRFNQVYCHVDPELPDADQTTNGGLFPIFSPKLGRVKRLVGLGAPNDRGQLVKMSKSLNNAVFFSDSNDIIKTKIMGMYTDPNRVRATDPGTVENNPLWIFHDAFNPDTTWVKESKALYRAGSIGDVACKKKLVEVLVEFITPIRERRTHLEKELSFVINVLKEGTAKANAVAEATLAEVKAAIKQDFFPRSAALGL